MAFTRAVGHDGGPTKPPDGGPVLFMEAFPSERSAGAAATTTAVSNARPPGPVEASSYSSTDGKLRYNQRNHEDTTFSRSSRTGRSLDGGVIRHGCCRVRRCDSCDGDCRCGAGGDCRRGGETMAAMSVEPARLDGEHAIDWPSESPWLCLIRRSHF